MPLFLPCRPIAALCDEAVHKVGVRAAVRECIDRPNATERNVNFSNILQNALMRELGVDKT